MENGAMKLVTSGSRVRAGVAVACALMGAWLYGASARGAQAPDPQDVAEGMRIYRTKADCQSCHGWAGDGRKMDTQMPDGANLRTTRLGRAGIVQAIKCGRPGRQMPAFDKFAYSDGRCNNMTQADLKRLNLQLPEPAATLQPREIELVTDFLFAKVIGQGAMDRKKCVEFWGSDQEVCSEFDK
jgi:mono/diheme cytochrome c family protein